MPKKAVGTICNEPIYYDPDTTIVTGMQEEIY
jgi:hypothetical protein